MSKLPEMGLHHDVPFDVYASWEAVSNSRLSLFNISPAHYQWGYKPPTKSQDVGTLIHTVVLEEDKEFAVIPNFHLDPENLTKKGELPESPKATKYYRHKVELFAAAHSNQTIVSQETYDMAMGVKEAIQKHDTAKSAFTGGTSEVSMLWRDEATGLVLKGRVDYLCERRFIDLKSTESCPGFNVERWGYHRQMAMYMDGLKACTGKQFEPWICAVEKTPPFGVMCAPVGLDALVAGYNEIRTLTEALSEAIFTDTWECYTDPVEWNLPT